MCQDDKQPMQSPTVSVIIPSKDRHDSVRSLLANLASQDYPADRIEIILIDDGSTRPYSFDQPNLRILRHDASQGAQKSRNQGLNTAAGPIAFICDDDVELLDLDFISRAVQVFIDKPQVAAVVSRKIDVIHRNGRTQQIDFSTSRPTLYSGDLVPDYLPTGLIDWGHGIYFVRRQLLLDLGGYDGIYGLNGGHSFREESDVHARLRQKGHLIWFLPDIAIKHNVISAGGHGPAVKRRLYWIAHNHIVFLHRHLPCPALRTIGFVLDIARYSWVQGRFRHTLSMFKGYLAGIRNAIRDRGCNQTPRLT